MITFEIILYLMRELEIACVLTFNPDLAGVASGYSVDHEWWVWHFLSAKLDLDLVLSQLLGSVGHSVGTVTIVNDLGAHILTFRILDKGKEEDKTVDNFNKFGR